MGEVHGFCDERFEPLAAPFRTSQELGMDEGASLAATELRGWFERQPLAPH